MQMGLPGFSPNLLAQQQRIASLPSDPEEKALAAHLIRLAQQNKVGTPEYFMAAGEYQNRQNIRQQQQASQSQQPPVMDELLAKAAQDVAPMDRGVAQLPVGGIGQIGNYAGAGGGIVAFDDGGEVQHYAGEGPSFVQSAGTPFGRGYESFAQNVGRAFYTSPEERLRRNLKNQLSIQSGFLGNFMPQTDEARANAKALYDQIDTMNIDQLMALDAQMKQNKGALAAVTAQTQAVGPDIRRAEDALAKQAQAIQQGKGPHDLALAERTIPDLLAKEKEMPPVAAAPAGPAMPSMETILSKLGGGKEGIAGLTTKQSVTDLKEAMKEAGYDPEFFKKQISDIEAKKAETKSDKQDAMNMRLIEAGLGILGGESPYAFVNIGKGASPALKGLQEDIKDIAKLRRDYDKSIRDLQVAEQSGNRDVALKAVDRRDRINEKLEDRKFDMAKAIYSGEIQKYVAGMPGATERVIRSMEDPKFAGLAQQYFKLQGAGSRVDTAILQEYAKNPWKLEALKDTDPNLYNYIKSQLSALAVPSALNAPTGKVRE